MSNITLADFDDKCLLEILENLNFGSLLNMAQINGNLSTLAAGVFRRKYSQWPIDVNGLDLQLPDELKQMMNESGMQIDADAFDRMESNLNITTENVYNSLRISDFNTILMVFKHFGHEIKRMRIETASWNPPFQQSFIGYLISRYSSDSLVEIHFDKRTDILLEYITKPLINVEDVTFSYYFNGFHPDFVQRVQTLLPQMKRLRISQFEQKNGSLELENVTSLDICRGHETSPANLHLPQLDTLRIEYASKRFDEYRTFLNEHSHLRHLHLFGIYMDDSQFQQFTANLTNLVEITLQGRWSNWETEDVSANGISEFLKSHDSVKRIKIIGKADEWKVELGKVLDFEHDWFYRNHKNISMSLERRWKPSI